MNLSRGKPVVGDSERRYIPDFIVRIDDRSDAARSDGSPCPDPLNLVVEVKGFRGEDAKDKANTMRSHWVPGVNKLGKYGRWEFAEFTEVWDMEEKFGELIESFVQAADAK